MNDFVRFPTRRQFLTRSATVLAGLQLTGRAARGMSLADISRTRYLIPDTAAARRLRPRDWFPAAPSAEQFRTLALVAMDAARSAGADLADIRIGLQKQFSVDVDSLPGELMATFGYGVRARVDGIWSMQHGVVLTADAVATAARTAVAGAKAYAAINRGFARGALAELAPAPAVTGEWHVPVQIDPFAVPLDDVQSLLMAFEQAPRRLGANVSGSAGLRWQADTRVFASTTGSLVTQELTRAFPAVGVSTLVLKYPMSPIGMLVSGLDPCSAGYEIVLQPDIPERIAAAGEEAIRLAEIPVQAFTDIGRYPVVFHGRAFANFLGQTLDSALDGDRVAGFEADGAGPSFLTPITDFVTSAAPTFSPLLTVSATRALPSVSAVQWDDDGVTPDAYTVIDKGHVVDMHTTRDTAPLLADWYQRHARPLRSHGCAVAVTPTSIPRGSGAHLTVAPARPETTSHATVDELAREMSHGFIVMESEMTVSPGLTLSLMAGRTVFEVRQGKFVNRMAYLTMSLVTKAMLNQHLVALGDAGTMQTVAARISKGIPWESMLQPVTAPAALCKDVDIVRPGIN